MKILIRLESEHHTDVQNEFCYNNEIELEWPFNFLPMLGDIFDCDSIVSKMPEFSANLCWDVIYVSYKKVNGYITPILCLRGE